jgi:hypothetical protein
MINLTSLTRLYLVSILYYDYNINDSPDNITRRIVYSIFILHASKEGAAMNTKILFAAIAIVVAFGIAAVIGPVTVPTPVVAQNMTIRCSPTTVP